MNQIIQGSFAPCEKCSLIDEPSCILETNCKNDLTKVDILIIAESPSKDDIKNQTPLTGKKNKIFRDCFTKYKLNQKNYLITNVVMCQTIDPETNQVISPEEDIIELCKINCYSIIDMCKPNMIVVLGSIGAKAMGIVNKDTKGITTMRGRDYNWSFRGDEYKVFLTLNPGFVSRNISYNDVFERDFENIARLMNGEKLLIQTEDYSKFKKISEGEKVWYKIPEKFYTDEYRLIDIQQLTREDKIMYIFRDKNNKKVYHYENMMYYFYIAKEGVSARKIIPYSDVDGYEIPYKEKDKINPERAYEADVRLPIKHSIDYYIQNKGEAKTINNNIYFMDIETDTGMEDRRFPKAEEALYPISMVSTMYNGKKTIYVVDNHTDEIKLLDDVDTKIFQNEKAMISSFVTDFKKCDPDIATGWNFISYDLQYFFNRLPRLGYSQGVMSNFGSFYVDATNFRAILPGIICVDQDHLYRMFTFTNRENYKLGNIASLELGETKVELPHRINEMYWKDINLTMEYNMQDTVLLGKLEKKLGHINLLNELREICHTTGSAAMSTFGQVDSIIISFLKRNNQASKNADQSVVKGKFIGAFVRQPIPGIYNWVTDFDFTSLYPSLIMTYNIGPNSFVMRFKDKTLGYNYIYRKNLMPKEFDVIIDPTHECKNVVMNVEQLDSFVEKENLVYTINGCFYGDHEKVPSVFSNVVSFLLDSRREYKKKMLDAKGKGDKEITSYYNTKQLVYKTVANSLYGVIGNKVFRFFNLAIAESITASGQEALKNCIIYADKKMESLCEGTEFVQPKSITKTEMYASEMPDIETPYIVTGDTDSLFCCFEEFKDINIETIEHHCETIQSFLNDEIIPNIINMHNGNLKFNRLDLKNELIIDRGLFLAKKRYVINVVRQEGKVINDIVAMGIETKRSDFPQKTKDFLNELIIKILKDDKVSVRKLLKYVDEKRGEFLGYVRQGEKAIAKPVGYGRKVSDYKKVPQNVISMLNWNDLICETHQVGDRGYLFKVNGIDETIAPKEVVDKYHKLFLAKNRPLKVISIPDDIDALPDYIIPDVNLMMEFVFEDRHKLLMEPFMIHRRSAKHNQPMLL